MEGVGVEELVLTEESRGDWALGTAGLLAYSAVSRKRGREGRREEGGEERREEGGEERREEGREKERKGGREGGRESVCL